MTTIQEWSDDDDNNLNNNEDKLYPLSEEDDGEYYNEYSQIVLNKLNDTNLDEKYNKNTKKEKKVHDKPKKTKCNLWNELNKDKVNKKWISDRMKKKRLDDGKIDIKVRKFNPRLPIPNKKYKYKNKIESNKINLNESNFPDLDI